MTARCSARDAVFGDELGSGFVDLTQHTTETRAAAIRCALPFALAGGLVIVHEQDCLLVIYDTPGDAMSPDDARCTCHPTRIEPERGWGN